MRIDEVIQYFSLGAFAPLVTNCANSLCLNRAKPSAMLRGPDRPASSNCSAELEATLEFRSLQKRVELVLSADSPAATQRSHGSL